ncbi:nucleotide exchange factor GrpE [Candidatus Woesearchaeota archaeon]|nr:nucleotide exchange factor GrpE [Candidatus Woesearchaeota archaeon]
MIKKVVKKHDKVKELTEDLQRVQAEFENYRKRVDKEKQEFCNYAKEDIIKTLLPVVDNFRLGFKHKANDEEFRKGVELIYAEFISILNNEGLKPIDALGQKFDPYKHEALLAEKSDKEENIVLEELQTGYTLKDKVIRPSRVKVSKK